MTSSIIILLQNTPTYKFDGYYASYPCRISIVLGVIRTCTSTLHVRDIQRGDEPLSGNTDHVQEYMLARITILRKYGKLPRIGSRTLYSIIRRTVQ